MYVLSFTSMSCQWPISTGKVTCGYGTEQHGIRSQQLFIDCSVDKWERARYLSSHEHDVIDEWQTFSESKSEVSRFVQPTTLGVYDSRPPLARYNVHVVSYLVPSLFLLF